ncbi:MAG: amidohydrolase family protein [Pseudomonadota bacterium]
MNTDDMIIVSVDDHIIEPPDMFEQHVPASLKSRAPRLETLDDGSNVWMFEGRKVINVGLNAVVGRPRDEYGMEPTSYEQLRKGTYDVHARVEDMNANGLLASLNFGTFVAFDGSFFWESEDKNLALAMVKAYNDWHIDEWCGAYPGRFIPMAILPCWDIAETVKEVERVVAKGCHAVTFSDNPTVKGLPSIHNEAWEPFWKVCNDNRVVINCHIGTGYAPPHPSMESPIDAWITGMPISIANSASDWLQLDALHRYPDLKIALSEGGIGWIPYFLERADFTYEHHHQWTHTDFRGKKPSDVFREHFITCFIDDRFGVKNRHDVGTDIICYECDYPHSDTVWPNTPEYLMKGFADAGVPDSEIDAMTHGNAMRAYGFDPFSVLGRENCTVGALRAQATHVDTEPKRQAGNRPTEAGDERRVTSGDVVKLFQANRGEAA